MEKMSLMNLNATIKDLLQQGIKEFFIYPYGEVGTYIFQRLSTGFGIKNIFAVDNFFCQYNEAILHVKELSKVDWHKNDKIVLISSYAPDVYWDVRLSLKEYVPNNAIVDLFKNHPFVFDRNARIASLATAAKEIHLNECRGSVAEAGVYRGDFAKLFNIFFPKSKLYLFDSFNGFYSKQVDENDNKKQSDTFIDTLKGTSVQEVLDKLKYPQNAIVKEGFVPDTFKGVDDKFIFVNLDMDIYSPTYDAMNFFWDKLEAGGYMFIHDFNYWDGITIAVRQFCKERKAGYFCIADNATAVLSKPI